MTTLCRPVLIESAEQAEVLPEGTIITHAEYHPQEKFAGLWGRDRNTNRQLAQQVGWTALVPIEAEEEWRADTSAIRPWGEPTPDPLPGQTRYVTPWEEA